MNNPISIPARYTSAVAVGFSDVDGALSLVRDGQPLPVSLSNPQAPSPLSGSASDSVMVGPYTPVSSRPVMITLSGVWTGSVSLLRSTDAGATHDPVTIGGSEWGQFSANACEPVWSEEEDGATLWLNITVDSGSVNYRLSQ